MEGRPGPSDDNDNYDYDAGGDDDSAGITDADRGGGPQLVECFPPEQPDCCWGDSSSLFCWYHHYD